MTHIVRNVKDQKPMQITCGVMRELTNSKDSKHLNTIHVTITDETREHYHKKLTEIYYVLKGSIDMELDGKVEHLEKNSMIMIFPNTKHKARKTSKENAEVFVICCPPWEHDDEVLTGK
jgi:mannose-6-phosphate isomerase-like protein (cupin superfamily)